MATKRRTSGSSPAARREVTRAANSGDTKKVSASAFSTISATSSTVKRAFTGTTIAPSLIAAKYTSGYSTRFVARTAIRITASHAEPRQRAGELVRARVELSP